MTLDFYIARRFLRSLALVLGTFLGILILMDLVEQLRRFGGTGFSFPQILGITLLNVPSTFYTVLPLLVVLAALWLFLSLARSSELVIPRAAGRSALRLLIAPVVVAALVGAASVALLNPMVAATSAAYDRADAARRDARQAAPAGSEGLWLRQGGAQGQIVIHAHRSSAQGTNLNDVSFFGFDLAGAPLWRIDANRAALTPGAWVLSEAKQWHVNAAQNPEATARLLAETTVPTDLTEQGIANAFGTPEQIAFWDLPAYIGRLERAGFSARKHRVWMQMELAQPLLLAAMTLIGAVFTLRHARLGGTGVRVLAGLGLGFGLFFLRNFARVLGETGQIPIALAAWALPLAAILLPLGLLLHLEDG